MNCTTLIGLVWAIASIYSLYWIFKDAKELTLFELIGMIVPAILFAPMIVTMTFKIKGK